MRSLALATALCLALFSATFAQDAAAPEPATEPVMTATAKITVEPAIKHMDAYTAVTAFVKAADLAPEGGWGEKDYDKVYPAMVQKGFELCGAWMGAAKAMPVGPGFTIYYESPETTKAGDLTCKSGFPIQGTYDPIEGVVIEEMPADDFGTVTYMGHYMSSDNVWKRLAEYITAQGYGAYGPPMEVYLVGPDKTQNPEEWVTEIRWPVKKKEAEAAPAGEE